MPLPLPHRAGMGMADFLVSESNAEAVAWIDRWPEWLATAMVLCGPEGAGKTHLAHIWKSRSGAGELQGGDWLTSSPETLPPVLLLEDADKFVGDAQAEEAIFHIYNRTREVGGSLLLTSRTPPSRWDSLRLADLRSRLLTAGVANISLPDEALVAGLLVKHFSDRQILVGEEVINFLVSRIERDGASVLRIVEALDKAALAENRAITIALARIILSSYATSN